MPNQSTKLSMWVAYNTDDNTFNFHLPFQGDSETTILLEPFVMRSKITEMINNLQKWYIFLL